MAAADRILSNRSSAAVFLAYHSVSEGGPPFLSVGPDLFERQLAELRRLGYRSGGHRDLHALVTGGRLDAPRVFLTFDDGFADNATVALPLLRQYGMHALLYPLAPLLDGGSALAWPEVEERRQRHPATFRSMDWPALEAMVEAGTEVGSHTCSHPHLDSLDGERLREELVDSRRRLIDRLGSCESLAYPFGDWSPAVASAAAAAGYAFAFSLPAGAQLRGGRLCIPRVPIDHRDDERRLRVKLSVTGRHALLSPARSAVGAAARMRRRTTA